MISSTTNRVRYTGDAATSAYDYSFQIDATSDLLVTVRSNASPPVETTLVLTTDFTVSGAGTTTGGTVTLVNASQAWLTSGNLKSGYKIVIRRKPNILQATDVRNQGDAYREALEDAFDRLAMYAQLLQDETLRSVRLPETYIAADFNPILPQDMDNSDNKVPTVNSTGDGWAAVADWPSSTAISGASASATAAAASAVAAAASEAAAAVSAAAAAAAVGVVVSGTFASPNSIAGSGNITFTAGSQFTKSYVQGSGGAQSLGNIQAGTADAQELILFGCSDTNTLTLDTAGRVSVKGTCVLAAGDCIQFSWDHGSTLWREMSRST